MQHFESFSDLLNFRQSSHPNRDALHYEGRTFTHHEIHRLSIQAANYLQELGINHDDTFAILDTNTDVAYYFLLGAAHLGAVCVFINWRLLPHEVDFIFKDSGAKTLLIGGEFYDLNSQGLKSIPRKNEKDDQSTDATRILLLPTRDELMKRNDQPTWLFTHQKEIRRDDTYVILYTSGTTGNPKGVPLTHGEIMNLLVSLSVELPGIGADGVNLVCGPFFHIAGVGYSLLGLLWGMKNVLVKKFDPNIVSDAMITEKVTNALLVPAMIQAIVHSVPEKAGKFPDLRHIQYGGSPISPILLRKAAEYFQCDFTQAYGLTETSGVSTLLRFDDHREIISERVDGENRDSQANQRIASAGKPLFGTQIRILSDDGVVQNPNELGEVCIKSPHTFKGYKNRPEENQKTFDTKGWFHTGDIGYLDESGFLFLVDRMNDKIISGAEKIYPTEVERIYFAHPKIQDISIVGVTDEKFGEIVCAVVVLKSPTDSLSLEDLRIFGSDKIASYKLPKRLEFIDELPRNPSGKVLRRLIKEKLQNGIRAKSS